ncbi:MAG: MoaD/ThiS family protein [Candidatus Bathyarchaeia archaeon]
MSQHPVTVRVRFYGATGTAAVGETRTTLPAASGKTISALLEILKEQGYDVSKILGGDGSSNRRIQFNTLLNGNLVPPDAYASTTLKDGDIVAFVVPLTGG